MALVYFVTAILYAIEVSTDNPLVSIELQLLFVVEEPLTLDLSSSQSYGSWVQTD